MREGIRVDRRSVIRSTGAAAAFGLAGCTGSGGGGTDEVRFILNPAEADVDITAQYQPMFDHIESETDVTVEAVETASYAATLQ